MGKINQEWIRRMSEGFDKKLGEDRKIDIMEGIEKLGVDPSDEEVSEWVYKFISKMDMPEYEAAAKELLMSNCPCDIYGEPDFINKVKEFYNNSSSVEDFIDQMHRQGFWNLVLEGDIIYTSKPYICECGYKHPFEGLYSEKCHCSLAARVKRPASKIFCNCGGGFYKPLFDEIWQADTVIEPVKTVIAGDDRCVFAIHVPEKLKTGR